VIGLPSSAFRLWMFERAVRFFEFLFLKCAEHLDRRVLDKVLFKGQVCGGQGSSAQPLLWPTRSFSESLRRIPLQASPTWSRSDPSATSLAFSTLFDLGSVAPRPFVQSKAQMHCSFPPPSHVCVTKDRKHLPQLRG